MPEITMNDSFGQAISRIIQENNYTHNLEIGSWDGTGSTQCFIDGMSKLNTADKILHCLEIELDRYYDLVKTVQHYPWIQTFNMSTIDWESFIPKNFEDVWNSPHNHLMEGELKFDKDLVKTWYDYDVGLLKKVKLPFLESEYQLNNYDAVLLDGGEFSAYSEYQILKDITKCFFLDDCMYAYKTCQIYCELLEDPMNWILLERGDLRNGYAIFRRKN